MGKIKVSFWPVNSHGDNFPLTRHSVVLAVQSDNPAARLRAMETIATVYWKPIYKYIRLKWNVPPEDAADFAQEFFTRLIEKEILDSYDSSKGRLRTFLRVCADRLFMNQLRDSQRLKRGAGNAPISIEVEQAEQELATLPRSASPEDCFNKEWVRSLFTLGLERMRANCENEGKLIQLQLFERHDLDDTEMKPSYAQLADEFEVAVTDVTNYLAFARRQFRACVLDQLREMTATDEEYRREAQALLGVEIK